MALLQNKMEEILTTSGRNPRRHQGNNIRQVGRDKLSQEGLYTQIDCGLQLAKGGRKGQDEN